MVTAPIAHLDTENVMSSQVARTRSAVFGMSTLARDLLELGDVGEEEEGDERHREDREGDREEVPRDAEQAGHRLGNLGRRLVGARLHRVGRLRVTGGREDAVVAEVLDELRRRLHVVDERADERRDEDEGEQRDGHERAEHDDRPRQSAPEAGVAHEELGRGFRDEAEEDPEEDEQECVGDGREGNGEADGREAVDERPQGDRDGERARVASGGRCVCHRGNTDAPRPTCNLKRSGADDAAEADVARRRVDGLRLARRRPVAQAVVGSAEMRAALDHAARDVLAWD